MALDDDGQAEAIAAEWGIDPDLLEEAQWELESNDNNDGFPVSYFVRFSEDTDRELLNRLGVRAGEFYREVSINAFDEEDPEPDQDEGIFQLPNLCQTYPASFETISRYQSLPPA